MTRRRIRLVREGFPDTPAVDTALSHATLRLVADGRLPETLRLHRPGAVVAFGPRDRVAPGFAAAVAAARSQGFASIERLAGGRAAVFHEGTLAFSWAIPDPDARAGIIPRFEAVAGIMADALRSVGVDARIGEVPGEYCPGEHSVNARGRTKLVGVGQRIVKGAAHVGGVVVVSEAARIRDVLIPVYGHLDLDWAPATVGSVEQEVPVITWAQVEEAVIRGFAREFDLQEGRIAPEALRLAKGLLARHVVEG
jgi:octanoyl-[GcvH]:protein N-octanoyltransferase